MPPTVQILHDRGRYRVHSEPKNPIIHIIVKLNKYAMTSMAMTITPMMNVNAAIQPLLVFISVLLRWSKFASSFLLLGETFRTFVAVIFYRQSAIATKQIFIIVSRFVGVLFNSSLRRVVQIIGYVAWHPVHDPRFDLMMPNAAAAIAVGVKLDKSIESNAIRLAALLPGALFADPN